MAFRGPEDEAEGGGIVQCRGRDIGVGAGGTLDVAGLVKGEGSGEALYVRNGRFAFLPIAIGREAEDNERTRHHARMQPRAERHDPEACGA